MSLKRVVWTVCLLLGLVLALPGITYAMNKTQLIDSMGKKSENLDKADSTKAFDAFVSSATKSLEKGDRVALVGFGSFSISQLSTPQSLLELVRELLNYYFGKKLVRFKAGSDLAKSVKSAHKPREIIEVVIEKIKYA